MKRLLPILAAVMLIGLAVQAKIAFTMQVQLDFSDFKLIVLSIFLLAQPVVLLAEARIALKALLGARATKPTRREAKPEPRRSTR